MSNKRQRNKRAVLERAANNMYGTTGIQGYGYGNRVGNTITIPTSIVMTMLQNMAPQKNQAQDFAPGSPLAPYQGVVPKFGPRQFSYPVGFNLHSGTDRSLGFPNIPSFAQLRTFATTYDGIALCERVILDMIPKLEPKVVLKKRVAEAGADENDYTPAIKRWTKFIENPSPGQGLDIHSWLRMAWTEQTQIDALSLFKRQTRGGHLFGLEIIDGATVKPLLDERGMVPQPPYPAYQQYLYGFPGDEYTREQMVYYRESPRANTPYGFSRVERIITRVNQALRKQTKDLARFTEGNVPAGTMEVPAESQWTPDQIDAFEQGWNSLMAGNPQQQVRIKFTQPGMKYTEFGDYANSEHLTEFDTFCLNVAVAAYGMSMGDLGFTGDIHKSSGDSQQNMMFRRTLAPFVAVYCRILTMLLCEAFGDDDLEVTFGGYEEVEDIQAQATAYTAFIQNAAISPAAVARLMKFPDIPETGPLLINQQGITPLANYEEGSDFRTAATAAQLAGMQLAAQAPQQQQQGADDGQDTTDTQSTQSDKTPTKAAPVKAQGKGNAPDNDAPTKGDIKRLMESVQELLRSQRGVQRVDESKRPEVATHHTGMMLAFLLDDATAQALALPDGEPASDLHTTLCYLGDMEDEITDTLLRPHTSPFKIRDAIAMLTSEAKPLTGHITGVGRFNPAETDEAALIALVDVPGLSEFRAALSKRVQEAGYFVAENHGYTPHITLQYFDASEPMPTESVPALPLTFDTVCLAVGDNRYFFRLGGQNVSFAQEDTERTSRDAAVVGRGDSQVATREASSSVTQPLASRADLQTAIDAKLIAVEYRKWREKAIADMKGGKAFRSFMTDIIPARVHEWISDELEVCESVVDVKAVFERAKQHTPLVWEPPDTDAQLALLTRKGVATQTWDASVGACAVCLGNDKQTVALGSTFIGLQRIVSGHPNCVCVPVYRDEDGHVVKVAMKEVSV
jgi:2'-5' RNA ligase